MELDQFLKELSDQHPEYKESVTQEMIDRLGHTLQIGDQFCLSSEYYNWYVAQLKSKSMTLKIGTPIQITEIDLQYNMVYFDTVILETGGGSISIRYVPLAMVYRMTKFTG